MKNRIFCLFLCCLLGLGNLAIASNSHLDGGIEVPVVEKTNVVLSVSIPDKYMDANGNFTLPIVAILTRQGDKKATNLIVGDSIQLPNDLSGTYTLYITIGDYHFVKELFFK